MRYKFSHIALIICVLLGSISGFSQSDKQKKLEADRQRYLKEIQQINTLLFTNKKQEKSVITTVEDLNYKVSVRRNLIKVTNDQANLLTREISSNQKEISSLRDQLKQLKEDYAAMVVKSYKSKSDQSRIMFLLSSENFKQAYKRLQYIKQYANYQKEQGEAIKLKTEKLQVLNTTLVKQKVDKQKLVEENRKAKQRLEIEVKEHETLMASIRQNMTQYVSQIKTKKQEIDKIDKEIDRLIKAAIAASKKKAGKTTTKSTSKGFALTPAEKALSSSFASNRGKLPWPVERGVIKVRFGMQPHPIDKSLTFNSKGIRISTSENAPVRAVFDGEVIAVITSKKGNPTVLIQHGEYLTAYSNLGKINVSKGDKVTTKQTIGEVFTDSSTNESTLVFRVLKETTNQNPEYWISR